jgi:hypothetical protein
LTLRLKYEKDEENIIGYINVDWERDIEKRMSTSEFIFLLGKGGICSRVKKQACAALPYD